jgi:predicted hydrocarbon binding protein
MTINKSRYRGIQGGSIKMYREDVQTPVMVISNIDGKTKFAVYEFGTSQEASGFCKIINARHPGDDEWIYAREITFGAEYNFEDFIRLNFRMLVDVDDLTIQKILREVSHEEIARALKSADKNVREKVLKNMSSRAREMLTENIEYMEPVRLKDSEEIQERMLNILRHLCDTGEAALPKTANVNFFKGDRHYDKG